jgi:hypothetical protein
MSNRVRPLGMVPGGIDVGSNSMRRCNGDVATGAGMLETEDVRGNLYQLEIRKSSIIHDFGFLGLGFWQLADRCLRLC